MRKRGVTIADIAAECRVSVMTVSRALRNDGVKSETRLRIMHIAERMGYYKRNRLGRPGHSPIDSNQYVELIIGGNRRANFCVQSKLLAALEHELAEFKIDCLLRSCDASDYQSTLRLLNSIRNSSAMAAILIGEFPPEILSPILELVPETLLIDNRYDVPRHAASASFSFDYAEIGRLAVAHFLSSGRRNILLLRGNAWHFSGKEVESGYRQAMAENAVPVNEELILETGYFSGEAYEVVMKALESGRRFDALLGTDEMIYGARKAILHWGLQVPNDVALCGCDDMPVNEFLVPPLTSIELNYRKLARMAVIHLISPGRPALRDYKVRLLPKLQIRSDS